MSKSITNYLRPKNFTSFFGHKDIIVKITEPDFLSKVTSIILHSKVPGVGKTSLARLIADQYINHCQSNIDIIEIDAGQHNSVDHYRALIENFKYAPLSGKRVIIIDESHLITSASGASLLKVVEEPPENHLFIFCTTNINKMLPTLISRSAVFELRPFTVEEITEYLSKNLDVPKDKIQNAANKANGSLRTAINLLNAATENKLELNFIEIVNEISKNKRQAILKLINTYISLDFYQEAIQEFDIILYKCLEENNKNKYNLFIKIQTLLLKNFIIAQQLPPQFIKQSINLTLLEILEIFDAN